MKLYRRLSVYLLPVFLGLVAPPVWADDTKPAEVKLPPVFDKTAPENVEDLKAIEKQVQKVLDKVIPCTVNVRIGNSQGSGVIVSKDGLVLTAGHVVGEANTDCTLVLWDGKTVKAKTLGANNGIDSGMIKITTEGEYPFAELGKSEDLKPGQWCIACGHPGGYKTGRPPVVRLGRILRAGSTAIQTDCTIVGGDSGGPLFDMQGRVIGIHSRIDQSITTNVHVPVDTYRDTWDRLVKGDVWGGSGFGGGRGPWVGVEWDTDAKDLKIFDVMKGSPAEKAGLKPKDVIKKFDGEKVEKLESLVTLLSKKKPGDEVAVEVQRGEETVTVKVVLGRRPRSRN